MHHFSMKCCKFFCFFLGTHKHKGLHAPMRACKLVPAAYGGNKGDTPILRERVFFLEILVSADWFHASFTTASLFEETHMCHAENRAESKAGTTSQQSLCMCVLFFALHRWIRADENFMTGEIRSSL